MGKAEFRAAALKKKLHIHARTDWQIKHKERNVAQRNHTLLDEIRSVCQVSGLLKTRNWRALYSGGLVLSRWKNLCGETEGRALALTQTHPGSRSG